MNNLYPELCPDCDSWDIKTYNEQVKGLEVHFTASCRECGSEWEDYYEVDGFDTD